jgi:hypothetical protein
LKGIDEDRDKGDVTVVFSSTDETQMAFMEGPHRGDKPDGLSLFTQAAKVGAKLTDLVKRSHT